MSLLNVPLMSLQCSCELLCIAYDKLFMLNYPLLELFNIDKPRCPFCYKEERTVIVQKERLMLMLLVLCCMCALTSNEVKWREFMLGVSVRGDQRNEVDDQ